MKPDGAVKINNTRVTESISESVNVDEYYIGRPGCGLYWGLLEALVILFAGVLATRRRGLHRHFGGLLYNA